MDDGIAALQQGMDAFLSGHQDLAISASRVINPLLELWELAVKVDPAVARPVEDLLRALVGRELTTSQELAATMAEVRASLAALTVASGV